MHFLYATYEFMRVAASRLAERSGVLGRVHEYPGKAVRGCTYNDTPESEKSSLCFDLFKMMVIT